MKKRVNVFMVIAILLMTGYILLGAAVSEANAAEITPDDAAVCETGHTPAEGWTIKKYAKVKSDGKRVKLCKVCGAVVQEETIPYIASVKLIHNKLICNGSAFKPKVQVTDKNGKIVAAANYTVKYYDNVWPGKGIARITFKGNYSGQVERGFKIWLGKTTITKIESTVWGTRIQWSTPKKGYYGYQVFRSTNGGKYESLCWIPSSSQRWYIDTKAKKSGAKYTYKIYVMKLMYGEDSYGSTSKTPPKSIVYQQKKLSAPAVANTSKGVKVSWKKVPYATYYEVRGSGYKNGVLKNNILIAKVKSGAELSIIDKNIMARTIKRDKNGRMVERANVNYYITAVVSTENGTFRSTSQVTKGKRIVTRKNKVPALVTR